jgi:hypothetical protein
MLTPAAAAAAAAAEEEEEEEEEEEAAAGSAPVTCHGAFNKAFSASLDHLLQVTLLIFGFENKNCDVVHRSLARTLERSSGVKDSLCKHQNKRGWWLCG